MIDHYNAFISYKHADIDNKIAKEVQQSLERFTIPGKIKKKTGIKKINRVFRDKDELPITSDLSDNISFALENADYLIVICSSNTKQSHWVPREIEYFLRNHTRKQILTVLVDGEPQDVIPDILLKEDRVVKDRDGNETTITVPLEPLSCDYRMPLKKARKEELPRLASALLGCSYDELMNRRRQYEMQKYTAIGAAILAIVLAFAGYMFYSKRQVQKALLESMINQSRYLSSESENLYDDEQRILAIQLALAALPSEQDPNRPVTAEAIRALTIATEAYVPLSGSNIGAVWNYTMDNEIQMFTTNEDAKFIAAKDSENFVSIWSTVTHEELLNHRFPERIETMTFAGENTLILTYGNTITAMDILKDSTVVSWTIDMEESVISDDPIITPDGNIMVASYFGKVYVINPSNGEIVSTYTLPLRDYSESMNVLANIELSPSGKKILYSEGTDGDFGVYDTTTSKGTTFRRLAGNMYDFAWVNDDTIVYAVSDSTYNSALGNITVTGASVNTIVCISATGRENWTAECEVNAVALESGFFTFPDKNFVAYYKANICEIYDNATGEVLHRYDTNSPILDISDSNMDGIPTLVTQSGNLSNPFDNYGANALASTKLFASNLAIAEVNDGVYTCPYYSKSIIYYTSSVRDENWTKVNGSSVLSSSLNPILMDEKVLAILETDDNNNTTLTMIDPVDSEVTHTIDLGEGYRDDFKLICVYDDKLYIMSNVEYKPTLISVDIDSGKLKSEDMSTDSFMSLNAADSSDGLIYYFYDDFSQKMLVEYNIETGKYAHTNIDDDLFETYKTPIFSPEYRLYYMDSASRATLYSMDEDHYTDIELPDEAETTGYAVFSKNSNSIAILLKDGIAVVSTESGDLITTIPLQGREVLGIGFTPEEDALIVTYTNDTLCRYNPEDGTLIGHTNAFILSYGTSNDYAEYTFDTENHLLYLSYPNSINVIDTESWVEIAYLRNCIGHSMESDRFYSYSYEVSDEVSLGYFNRYSMDDLIAKAHEIIGDSTLSEEDKLNYGIN